MKNLMSLETGNNNPKARESRHPINLRCSDASSGKVNRMNEAQKIIKPYYTPSRTRKIIDGGNRYEALIKLGLPILTERMEIPETKAGDYVLSMNLAWRQPAISSLRSQLIPVSFCRSFCSKLKKDEFSLFSSPFFSQVHGYCFYRKR